jgi:hypothetical protein
MNFRSAFSERRLVVRQLPDLGFTARLAANLSVVNTGTNTKPATDLNHIAARFITDLKRGIDPSISDWHKVAWCIWTTRPAIAEYPSALDAVLGRVARMQTKRPYRQLASSYLTDFAPDRPEVERVADVLAAHAAKAGDPWDRLQVQFGIFAGKQAYAQIARLALNSTVSLQQLLETARISGVLAEAGFADAVHCEAMKLLRASSVAGVPEHLETVRRWCLRADDTMIFRHRRTEMARAVIYPFGDRVPTASDRDLVLGFLVSRFGDPRVNPAQWIGMDDVAEILKRWLTEQSLRQFFDVVDRIAPDGAWKYRRAFWQAYHEAGLIRNAWVVFGNDGAAEARRSFGQDVRFGRFKGGGRKQVQQGHAVLLLDLGQCVVADWSYNGFCNVWPTNDKGRPQNLTAPSYTSDEVRREVPTDRTEYNLTRNDIFGHGGSENYVWQDRVAGRLQELVGVRVTRTDYRVS